MHLREYWLIGVVAIGLVVAAVVGDRLAPGRELRDPRRSALLTGPFGAKGMADALRLLGVDVVLHRRPLFALLDSSSVDSSGAMIALMDIRFAPTGVERRMLRSFVGQGNALLLAGRNGVEHCFGVRVSDMPIDNSVGAEDLEGGETRKGGVALPEGIDTLPEPEKYLEPIPPDSVGYFATGLPDECGVLLANVVDTLLSCGNGKPVAAKMRFGGGGRLILIADSRMLANESLKETDAGLLVLDWILSENPGQLIIDEYHQGFQLRGSIVDATWRWVRSSPIGWMVLQLLATGVAAVGLMAVRFGPALPVVQRKRRSPVEHVEALAAGLERCGGEQAAVSAFISGLRRRLSRGSAWEVRGRGGLDRWLAGLALAVRTPGAREKVAILADLRTKGGHVDLLAAASTVEDLWEALGRQNRSKQL